MSAPVLPMRPALSNALQRLGEIEEDLSNDQFVSPTVSGTFYNLIVDAYRKPQHGVQVAAYFQEWMGKYADLVPSNLTEEIKTVLSDLDPKQ